VGLLAGLVGALVYLLVSWPMTMVVGPMMEEWMHRVIEITGDEGLRGVIERYRGGGARAIGLVIGFFFQVVFGALFGTLGGLLGAVLFKKAAPPEPAAPPPPGPPVPPPPGPPPLPPQAS
jgi:amino acid permease